MKTIGNLIWFLFGGLWMGLGWTLVGLVWCISIIGIPVGIQCFFPFGKVIVYGGGAPSLLCNILWLIFGGFALAISAVIHGLIFCITIVGIPFGMQCFKFARLALTPFGSDVAVCA
mgnify:CR=1 FL=1